jgi:hypothetical protein
MYAFNNLGNERENEENVLTFLTHSYLRHYNFVSTSSLNLYFECGCLWLEHVNFALFALRVIKLFLCISMKKTNLPDLPDI